ncbi:peptidoglycan/xylan/chitin deacetylase (PgdA/CDA1 family) [Allocatelliglobosispora scoriae]|uniref:Peptidoglycan/xylan/chitin deacetylase (PgdA/CDA1 family) n=1 Tax=Allocatelliglobosispora scoriae TaxID=643052 RepID=A0A841C117_9ACTN|nr:polysaccharide deacetylase family protein [Allocatelliglobosispora scoriae]MBB5873029.1 peptidoglycan/xylan/chitin deacetylase (PgdA/CDA1 family) [Allocatelliglobosispora scoriae]
MAVSRRGLLLGSALTATGAAVGATAHLIPSLFGPDRLPLDGGYAPAGNADDWTPRGQIRTIWHVPTDQPLVALTFDDGPMPDWTPRVLDALDKADAPATFFMVGQNLRRHADLVKGRLGRHEVGNHTWEHKDLAKRDEASVRNQLVRCHEAIREVTGQTATLLRPPWGHLGGSTLTVADTMDYDVVMWSYRMPEDRFRTNPAGIVDDVAACVRPGTIMLAHDTGPADRLVTIDNLGEIIKAVRGKGMRLVTVSELLAAGTTASPGSGSKK